MGDVIEFDRGKEGGDETACHLQGPATCTNCKHEWQAVTEAGEHTNLKCPKCQLFMGILGAPVVPPMHWLCDCGGELFYLTPDGAQCRTCGVIAQGWAD